MRSFKYGGMPEFNNTHHVCTITVQWVVGMIPVYRSPFSPLLSLCCLTYQISLINTTVAKMYDRCYREEIWKLSGQSLILGNLQISIY